MTPQQAKAAIVLFESGHFDTLDIAQLLGVTEPMVVRTLQASRDIVREMYRDGTSAERRQPKEMAE